MRVEKEPLGIKMDGNVFYIVWCLPGTSGDESALESLLRTSAAAHPEQLLQLHTEPQLWTTAGLCIQAQTDTHTRTHKHIAPHTHAHTYACTLAHTRTNTSQAAKADHG